MRITSQEKAYFNNLAIIKTFKKRLKNETDQERREDLKNRLQAKEKRAQELEKQIKKTVDALKSETLKETAILFYKGAKIDEIARKRGLTTYAIAHHLGKIHQIFYNENGGGTNGRK